MTEFYWLCSVAKPLLRSQYQSHIGANFCNFHMCATKQILNIRHHPAYKNIVLR